MDGIFAPWHLVIVAILAVALFYRGDKLPDMARSFGRSLRVFKTEIKGLAEDDKAREAAKDEADPGAQASPTLAIEAPPVTHVPPATEARVVAVPSEPIPVQAEIVRPSAATVTDPVSASAGRPRPRPAGSGARQ